MHFLRILSAALVLLVLLSSGAALAEHPLYPAVSHPGDQYAQSLSIMSQKDSVFEGIRYNDDWLAGRGCQPFSLANGVIAAFGVTDRDTAIGIVLESTRLLAPGGKYLTRSVTPDLLGNVIDPAKRAAAQENYPNLAKTVGVYPGQVTYQHEVLSPEQVMELVAAQEIPAIVGSRMYVVDTWENVVRIAYALHDMGYDNAAITLARAGAGKDNSGAPLRSGKNGHYLTLMLHVGAFMETGAVYVLDSLPRALRDEPVEDPLRSSYPFPTDRKLDAFNNTFSASRISPAVIRLSLKDELLAGLKEHSGDARILMHANLMKPLVVFGACSMLISLR